MEMPSGAPPTAWSGGLAEHGRSGSASLMCGVRISRNRIRARPDAPKGYAAYHAAMSWHWMDGWGWAMMAFGVAFWAAVIGLAVWAVGEWSRGRGGRVSAEQSPREILDRRFARGEIDLEAYTRAIEALTRSGEPAAR